MPRVPSRSKLEEMNRVDIQKLCKDLGVRANLKTTALIDLLLDASKPAPAKPAPTPRSRTASSATRVSSRRTSGRSTRGFSRGSVIIHDSEPEDDQEEEQEEEGGGDEEEPASGPEPDNTNETDNEVPAPSEVESSPPPPTTRTRKAKDTQTRLGMGRPVIAGGSGARAVTKSISISKGGKRGKNSRSVQPVQETIPEEEPEQSPTAPSPLNTTLQPNLDATTSTYNTSKPSQDSLASLEAIDKRVADAIRPLHAQMSSLKSEVERLKNQAADLPKLQIKVLNLTTELETLRKGSAAKTSELEAEIGRLKEHWGKKSQPVSSSSSAPGTPGKLTPGKYGSLQRPGGFSGPSAIVASKSLANGKAPLADPAPIMTPDHPGFAATVTGKRRRDSDAGDITGVIEEGHEDEYSEGEIQKRVIVPTKKRARLDDGEHSQEGQASGSSQAQSIEQGEQASNSRPPSFTIFSGPDEPDNLSIYIDPPPPTNHLPEYFTASPDRPASGSSGQNGNGAQTSTAHASENQNPFGFNFLPMTSTPMHPMYPMPMQNFPYPEAPTSPSPAGNDRAFQFGMHTSRPRSGAQTSRPGSRQEGDGTGTIDPAALTGRQPEPSSTDAAAGLDTAAVPGAQGAAAPGKRTMYGTELDGDSRFGDFGFEGVASGFWAGGRF